MGYIITLLRPRRVRLKLNINGEVGTYLLLFSKTAMIGIEMHTVKGDSTHGINAVSYTIASNCLRKRRSFSK